jgi:8-amino-7-oxononanoate synthase
MLDFTSALYLGMRHAHNTLPPWAQLTTGRPAALEPPLEAESLARALARLWRCERATLGPSTLHLFWDLFDVLAGNRIAVYADAGLYPIARWGVERAAAKGVPTATFPTHDPTALEAILHRHRRLGRRPVVVTDGLCPATGRTAPLPQYLELVRAQGGYLVVDDTQALGILGRDPGRTAPYGLGGAGTLAWCGIDGPELIVGSSLAKGFGAPLAALAGDARVISTFEDLSSTRIHCSPPSLAAIGAAARALAVNEHRGDRLRGRLARLVRCFRDGLRQIGLSAWGGLFPVQTLKPIPGVNPERLYRRLLSFGVKAVLHQAQNMFEASLGFLITALHTRSDIGGCVDALQHACAVARREGGRSEHGLSRAGYGVSA